LQSENLKGRNRLRDISIDGRITIKVDIKEMEHDGAGQIHLPQNRFQWLAVVNIAMNVQIP
jgi:hypothetical protein